VVTTQKKKKKKKPKKSTKAKEAAVLKRRRKRLRTSRTRKVDRLSFALAEISISALTTPVLLLQCYFPIEY